VKIIRNLRELGGDVVYHDAHIPELPEFSLSSSELGAELGRADIVVIVTAHPEVDYEHVVREAALVLDFRGVTRGIGAENLVRL
jgi:UDP-N-acetyl-D-glucosamine dehydrogenase